MATMSVRVVLWLGAVLCSVRGDKGEFDIECPVTENFTDYCHCTVWEVRCGGMADFHDLPAVFTEYTHPFSNISIMDVHITNVRAGALRGIKTREIFLVGVHIETIDKDAFVEHAPMLEALYLSFNRISTIQPGTFSTLSQLIRLKLEGNLLTSVDATTFSQLHRLRNLYLHDNLITSVADRAFPAGLDSLTLYKNRMTALPENVFQGMNVVHTLNLRENMFTTFPDGLFRDMTAMEHLDLSWNNLTTIGRDLFRNTVALRSADLALNSILYIHPESFSTLHKLSFLDISNNRIQVIPGPLFANLSALRILYISNNLMKELPEDMSHGMEQLRTLHIQYNRLSHIGRTPLLKIIHLEDLRLDHNIITDIGYGAFDHLGSLRKIDLSDNLLRELYNDPFQSSGQLDWLDLSKNQIYTVTDKYFRNLTAIKFLDLSGNHIHDLAGGSFTHQINMKYLNLTNNWLEHIEDGMFENNTKLELLKLDSNPLQELSNGVLVGLESLETLLLNNTCMQHLPDDLFEGTDSLKVIIMQNSRLKAVMNETFSGLLSLVHLDLSHNDIGLIEAGAFAAPFIRTIKLSHNKVGSPGVRAITSGMSSYVDYLDISHNDVTDLVGITPPIFQEVESLFFAGNPFVCDCDSEIDWISTLANLKDFSKVSCQEPSIYYGMQVVCFAEECGNYTFSEQPFLRMCNESLGIVDLTSTVYLKESQHMRTTMRDVCDLSQYTTPTTTTMSTRPGSTTSNMNNQANVIRITVTTEPAARQKDIRVTWQVATSDITHIRGYRITHHKQPSGADVILLMSDPDKNTIGLFDLDVDEAYEVCVQVLVQHGENVTGGSHCATFRTRHAAPKGINFTLIIIIAVAVVVAVILLIVIITCVCLRRQRRISKAKKVGLKHGTSSMATSPQKWLAPDVTLIGNHNDQTSVHSDESIDKKDGLPNGNTPSSMFDGSDIWLDANIVNDPFPDDLSQNSYSQLRRGNSALSARPDMWFQQDQAALSRSASDVGKSSKWKIKPKNKNSNKTSDVHGSIMGRAGMWVDSFAEAPDVHVEVNEELGEQTTLSLNIFDGKANVANGGPPSVFGK